MVQKDIYLEDSPLWYKDAIIYEVHIKAFYDSDGNGIGDFKGLRRKLDYLEDLGVTAIWLLPFYPSPLKDDGYDIADYYNVHHDYGTLRDFREFLRDAHARGIRVITELVLNHTSDQHPWFQRARMSPPGSRWRDYYVWSDTAEKYSDARIIFQDFENSNWRWDPVAKAYYWHRFYSHQPDLNFDNPSVQKAVLKAIDFWFGMGVDGLRLDAVPYLYEREGTNCENLQETYSFLKRLREHVDSKHKDKMLLAEANQWPEDAVEYFGEGDECHMAFHFPLMPRMFMAIQMEDRFPILDIFDQTPEIPDNCQWAIFLRNHDELTLEMVTDEERDYMYRIYARDTRSRINLGIRRRLSPLLENDRKKIELMNALLLTLPGTPVIYYGDELGMGDNYYLGDRDGVRTPMQWSADKNAGFSNANPQKLFLPIIIDPAYHYETVNVENQERSSSSLLWWMRRFIAMRRRFKAFGRGTIEFLTPENPKVLAFVRRYEDESILVLVNLSRHPQFVELDLSEHMGCIPMEVFGRNRFSPIKEAPYMFTMGSYGYYCFELVQQVGEAVPVTGTKIIPEIRVSRSWERFLEDKERERFQSEILTPYVWGARWFVGKARQVQQMNITESIPAGKNSSMTHILLVEVHYTEGIPDTYFLPISFAEGESAQRIAEQYPHAVIARLTTKTRKGIIYDGMYNEDFCMHLLAMILRRHEVRGIYGELTAHPGRVLRDIIRKDNVRLEPHIIEGEQHNTVVVFGNELFMKTFRHLDVGRNPDLEVSQYLSEQVAFPHAPAFGGGIEYRRWGEDEPVSIALLQQYVPNHGDAWRYYMDAVESYFERILSQKGVSQEPPEVPSSLLDAAAQEVIPLLCDMMGGGPLEMTTLLGKRTAEMHRALSSGNTPGFSPEPFSLLYQRSVYQSMQSQTKRVFEQLRKHMDVFSEEIQEEAREILGLERKILSQQRAIHQKKISAMKTRIHGDYHLGQVLYTGKDFVILDFEGEPSKALGERKIKRSPLRDVASMVRSFHYVAYGALFKGASTRPEDRPILEEWADMWYRCMAGVFLSAYLDAARNASFLPRGMEELNTMLQAFLLEQAIFELGQELSDRPDWAYIPLRGITHLMEGK